MIFNILTLFPDQVKNVLSESIIKRAEKAGIIEINAINIRDFSSDKNRRVDDTPYGGGYGMLLKVEPIAACHEYAVSSFEGKNYKTIFMSPSGTVLTQKKAYELSKLDALVIICGHYEGIDRRAVDILADEEISIGDYILTGGELPACILTDCVARLVDGVLSDKSCHEEESISSGLLEYPQYTHPPEFRGHFVPEVLLGGNHTEIKKWRRKASINLTKKNRPDLI